MGAHVSSLFQLSRSKLLQDGLRVSSVSSISSDFISASGLVVWPKAVLFRVQDVPASSCLLLIVVAERVDSAYDRVTCYEFVRHVEVALPRDGLNYLLLNTWPFNSRLESYGQLGYWDYHHLQ